MLGKIKVDFPLADLIGNQVHAIVDTDRRAEIERAHTATHLLHAALRKILGEHVKQEGSLVEPGRLRFDFYHPSPMTREEIAEVEKQVYAWIIGNHQAEIGEMSRDQAAKLGALAFFGEKYGEDVRVIQIKNKRTGELLSAELCGGTHLERTGDVGMFLVTAETGVAAGIRRIEALVGNQAWEQMADIRSTVNEISGILKAPAGNLIKSIEELKGNLAHDSKAREQITREYTDVLAETILSRSTNMDGVDFVTEIAKSLDRDGLRLLADALKSRRQKIVGILAAPDKNGRLAILCFSSKPTETDYDAGQILKHVAKKFKGGGGGKSTLAEGSIAETSLDKLTSIFKEAVTSAKDGK